MASLQNAPSFTLPALVIPSVPPGRPLVRPDGFPPAAAFTHKGGVDGEHARELTDAPAEHEQHSSSGSTAVTLKRTREEVRSSTAEGRPRPTAERDQRYDAVALTSPSFPLLEAPALKLGLSEGALAAMSAVLHRAASAPALQHEEGAPSRALPLREAARTFSSVASATQYFNALYDTPEKTERDTRRPVDYDTCMKLIHITKNEDNLDACISCLTRGQHAHYAPGMATVYTTHGTRAPRWKNSAAHPDAMTVTEVVAAEQAELKLKLMYAVCSCPGCRWHAPAPPAVAPPAEAKSRDDDDDNGDDLLFDVEGPATETAEEKTKAEAPRSAPHKRPLAPPATAAGEDAQGTHAHGNYNFIDPAHVLPFAKRRRLARTEKRVAAFLLCIASECGWLAADQTVSAAATAATPAKDGDTSTLAARTPPLALAAAQSPAGRPSKAPPLRENHVIRLKADQFAERYRRHSHIDHGDTRAHASQPASTDGTSLITVESLRGESVHSQATTVASLRVAVESPPLVAGPGGGAAAQKGRPRTKQRVVEDEGAARGPLRHLSYERLDGMLPSSSAAAAAAALSPEERRAAFQARWEQDVDASGTLHTPHVMPIAAVTRAMCRTVFANAAARRPQAGFVSRLERTRDAFLAAADGVSLVLDKRALHTLLTAHTSGPLVPRGMAGFRVPVRVRIGSSGEGSDRGDKKGKLVLHVEVGKPFPRPVETRREMHAAAAKRLLRAAMQVGSATATPSPVDIETAAGEEGARRRARCCAEVHLRGSGDRIPEGAPASAGAVCGSDSSPPTAVMLPGSPSAPGMTFHVLARATSAADPAALVFDMVKLDYWRDKMSACGARVTEREKAADGEKGKTGVLGIRTDMFDVDGPSHEAKGSACPPNTTSATSTTPGAPLLLEAFSASESLEISLLLRCFPSATVRVHHVNAYTGRVLHVDNLTAQNWQPLLLRRLTTITATLNPMQLAEQRERRERELMAAAISQGPGSVEDGGMQGGEDRKGAKAMDHPANSTLFLPTKDHTTAMALESMADVRYAWDCLLDVLANLLHQAVLGVACQLCDRAAAELDSAEATFPPSAASEPSAGDVFSFMLVRLDAAAATAAPPRHGKAAGSRAPPPTATGRRKAELCLQDVAAVYPGLKMRFDPAEEVAHEVFVEKASGAVCEREYAGLRAWPFPDRIPMTFRLRDMHDGGTH